MTSQQETQAATELEALIDRIGIAAVLELTANVCYEKAEHLESNWQDSGSATAWRHAAAAVLKVAVSKSVTFVQKVYGPSRG